MLQSYLKTAFYNLAKHRNHVLINLIGLTLGMTSCILIMLYVVDELQFDDWIADADRVYRYETEFLNPQGTSNMMRRSAYRVKRDLLEYFPDIEQATRIISHDGLLSVTNAEYFDHVWFVDPEFPEVFNLTMLEGDAAVALNDKNSVLLSASMARKYFGREDAVDLILSLDGQRDLRVAGVFQDIPDASHVDFSIVTRYDELDPLYNFGNSDSWSAVEGYTYVKLAEGVSGADLSAQLPAFLQSHATEFDLAPGRAVSDLFVPRLLNIGSIHLDAGGIGNIKTPGSKRTLFTLSVIAALVLLIAGINYVNLSSLRSLDRTKEVFVHKATGAVKAQIVMQMLLEPVLVSLVALVVAISLVELLLPLYGGLLGRELATDHLANIVLLVELVPLAVLIGVISGAIPAFTLSSMSARALKEGRTGGRGRLRWLQSALVTLQFSIAATLVLASLVVFLQQAFLEKRDLGFVPGNKLVLRNLGAAAVSDRREVLANELSALPGVNGVTFSVATPGDTIGAFLSRPVTVPGYRDEALSLYPKAVAPNFFEVYGVRLLGGRYFSAERASDAFSWDRVAAQTTSYAATVLNRTAAAAIGFAEPEAAVGETVVLGSVQLEVVGVVEDFHFQSLRDGLTPNFYIYSPAEYINLTLAYGPGADPARVAADAAAVWESVMPDYPLVLESVVDNVSAQYANDRRQFLLVAVFSCLAIVIACMGLYALAAYTTRRRTREIGVRKVHGALRSDITRLFLVQFTRPVLLANVLALPSGIYLTRIYLDAYEYHVEPGAGLFLLVGLLTLGMAWLAIIFQTVKAASARPVLALRYE